MKRRVAIVGIGTTYHRSKRPDVNTPELCYEAVREALEDANLEPKDIDMVVYGNMEFFENHYRLPLWQSDYIGGYLKPSVHLATGGTVGATIACGAFEYCASGVADIVLVLGFEKQSEADSRAAIRAATDPLPQGRTMAGAAVGAFARFAFQYMLRSGCKEEHAAMVRLRADRNACRNPKSHLKLGLKSVNEILESPYLITPIRLLDMCPTSEGATAMIIAPEEKAKKIHPKPVWAVDWEICHNHGFGMAGAMTTASHTEAAGIFVIARNFPP